MTQFGSHQPSPPTDAEAPIGTSHHRSPSVQEMQAAVDLFSAGRYAEVEATARQLATEFPASSFGWKLLGAIYVRSGRYPEALKVLQEAAIFAPLDAEVHNTLASALLDTRQLDAAIESSLMALKIRTDFPEARNNLASVFILLGRFSDAEVNSRLALSARPDFHPATFNLAIALLGQGKYSEGWACYQIRPMLGVQKIVTVPHLPFPEWRGEPIEGKSLLLWPEQGFGDYVQFVRYASLLKQRGVSRLTVRCPAPLKDLLATAAGVDQVITDAEPVPPHDYWSFPLSLPLHFNTTLESIPASLPYLRWLPERVEHWRARLPNGVKVGLAWKGSSGHSNDSNRSLPGLDTLRPLWGVPGVSFVSLQKGAGEDEARRAELPIIDLGSGIRDFADTAAIIDQLDLVICVDTAIAHVAGALGKPCWVLLPAIGCDWRWMRDRSDSPWYPGALRLFRQKESGDWSSVIDEVAIALRALLQ